MNNWRNYSSRGSTISEVLSEVTGRFDKAEIPESDIVAKFLVAHALNINQVINKLLNISVNCSRSVLCHYVVSEIISDNNLML